MQRTAVLLAAGAALCLVAWTPTLPPPAAPALPARADSVCADVTIVTRPSAVMTIPRVPERYTPTTVQLCEGEHELRFRAEGHDTVRVRIRVVADTPQHHLVRLPRRRQP